MRMVKRIISTLLVVGLIWAFAATINDTRMVVKRDVNDSKTSLKVEDVEELPKVNFKAPTFSLKGLNGNTYSLEKMKGTPVVVNFWASWCTPCKIEAPELVKLYDSYEGEVEFFAVNLTSNDTLEGAKAFANNYNFDFPVLLDDKGEVASKYRVVAIPSTFFINEKGIIVDQIVGFGGTEILAEKIDKLAN